jgi:choline dehydrogenase-like flavoprotein
LSYDVIVIGAGGGGPVVAKELAARGLSVLMLEAGPRYADPPKQWTHYENDANNPVTGFLRFGPSDRSRGWWFRDLPQKSVILQCSGVGGTTLHYLGNSPRAMPGAFSDYTGADAAAYDVAHRFPFGYRDLVPYYEWVEATLPVQTAALGHKDALFLAGAQGIGLPSLSTKDITLASCRAQENAILQPQGTAGKVNAILSPHAAAVTGNNPAVVVFPQAQGCTFCGHCFEGCMEPKGAPRNLYAKRSTDNSYVPMALTAGAWSKGGKPVKLVADAFATRIGTALDGSADSVTWRSTLSGTTFTEGARVVVLAAGAIESPRLWLNSGLANTHDQVGRGCTDHYPDIVAGVMPFETGLSRGPNSAARADFPGYGCIEPAGVPPAFAAAVACFTNSGFYGYNKPSPPGVQLGGHVGNDLKALLGQLGHVLGLIVTTDDDVHPDNRVTLAQGLVDEHGPIARLELPASGLTARTTRNRDFLIGKAVAILKAAGATQVFNPDTPHTLIHIHSTLRIGASATDSALDASAEAHEVKRLFVADNSALSNSLGGPNPTLTTQALATRTAETIYTRYFDGAPWVGREDPVVSTDERVTRALLG